MLPSSANGAPPYSPDGQIPRLTLDKSIHVYLRIDDYELEKNTGPTPQTVSHSCQGILMTLPGIMRRSLSDVEWCEVYGLAF